MFTRKETEIMEISRGKITYMVLHQPPNKTMEKPPHFQISPVLPECIYMEKKSLTSRAGPQKEAGSKPAFLSKYCSGASCYKVGPEQIVRSGVE